MNHFGDAIRQLMELREVTGRQLAADIGISPVSVSKILNGQSKPRQVTLSRLIKRLCETPEDEQLVVRTFTADLEALPDEPEFPERPISQDEIDRVSRYLEIKAQSVAFEKEVELVIKTSAIKYQKDFQSGSFIADFMVSVGKRRIAVDCKYNVNRDWDRTYATVQLLLENLPCDKVIIVIPQENDLARKTRPEIEAIGGRVVDIQSLAATLKTL